MIHWMAKKKENEKLETHSVKKNLMKKNSTENEQTIAECN